MASLIALLQATQSNNDRERAAAEQALAQASRAPDFCVALAALLTDENGPVPLRQLAGVMLKQFASKHWATMPGDPDQSLIVVNDAQKVQVKRVVPLALASPHSKIRTAAATVIAAVGRTDFPAKWPSLLNDLVACLKGNNKLVALGALKCLDFLATSQLADDQVPLFLQTVFPALHTVFVAPHFDESAKSRAASVVAAVVLWIGAMQSQNPEKLAAVISQSMQMWMEGFCSVLAKRDSADGSCQLKIKIMTIVAAYAHYFPKQFRPFASKIAELVWGNLLHDVPIFESSVVQADLLGDAVDSDGNATGFELLVASYLDFVSTLATKKSFKDLVTRSYPSLVRALFSYAQLSSAQCEQFLQDPNEFVAAEDDDLQSYSIRFVCVELVQHLASVYRKDFLSTFLKESRSLNFSSSWKLRESFVYLVGSLVSLLRKHADMFDFSSFVSSLLPDLSSSNPFLRGRALWCAAQSKSLAPNVAVSVCQAATRLLSDKKEHLPVRFAAVKAVGSLCSLLPSELCLSALLPSIDSCCAMLALSTAETVPAALETMETLLQAHPRACIETSALVSQHLLQIWQRFAADQFVTELVVDLVATLAQVPECMPHLASRFAPAISSLLLSPSFSPTLDVSVIITAVELLALLATATPNCLQASPVFGQLFNRVAQLAWTADDVLLMQACTKCLLGFVISNGANLSAFRVEGGQTATAFLIALVSRMLDASRDEAGCDGVGKLMLKMIQLLDLNASLPSLLMLSLARLASTSSPSLVQTLVLVFARLVHREANSTLNLLAAMKAPDGSSGLSFLLRVWVENQSSFYGSYQTKVTLFALVLLFKLNSPQINAIKVKGAEIVDVNKRATRSKGPLKYAEISIQQKIFELCVAAFVERARDNEGDENEEEMDEFSSEEEDDFLGLDEDTFAHHGTPLDALLRMANQNEADDNDNDDPEFRDDPINKRDLLIDLREFLFGLMKQSSKAFEASVGLIADSEIKGWFYNIWPAQVGIHLAAMQKKM